MLFPFVFFSETQLHQSHPIKKSPKKEWKRWVCPEQSFPDYKTQIPKLKSQSFWPRYCFIPKADLAFHEDPESGLKNHVWHQGLIYPYKWWYIQAVIYLLLFCISHVGYFHRNNSIWLYDSIWLRVMTFWMAMDMVFLYAWCNSHQNSKHKELW